MTAERQETDVFSAMVVRFDPKVGQIGPKLDNPETFHIRIQYILTHQNVLKYDLKKSHLGPNLTYLIMIMRAV